MAWAGARIGPPPSPAPAEGPSHDRHPAAPGARRPRRRVPHGRGRADRGGGGTGPEGPDLDGPAGHREWPGPTPVDQRQPRPGAGRDRAPGGTELQPHRCRLLPEGRRRLPHRQGPLQHAVVRPALGRRRHLDRRAGEGHRRPQRDAGGAVHDHGAKDATPGDHPAGIAATVTSTGGTVNVESRVGFRVMLRVNGSARAALAVRGLGATYTPSWDPFAGGTVRVRYTVENDGNVWVSGTSRVAMSDLLGRTSHDATSAVEELLPGGSSEGGDPGRRRLGAGSPPHDRHHVADAARRRPGRGRPPTGLRHRHHLGRTVGAARTAGSARRPAPGSAGGGPAPAASAGRAAGPRPAEGRQEGQESVLVGGHPLVPSPTRATPAGNRRTDRIAPPDRGGASPGPRP